ncbi:U3 small nucleolar RNA-associated protein MPP10 [Fistulifera solaris]|uniref:U3 small nucleolar ribonucleoprotein protein MPP10 n=1 Tax=Fistulifera solaris TaxID=1519565 RepID=A0A1Z5KBT7_FISSO|nr:U3 small nucleolar RNA-associated protein MPP10 [Fistulifera solaris]|eukprot:GAX23615.1 U3 small nucleolar RNA-associated protein MPP10 [Fistulifera solaris]
MSDQNELQSTRDFVALLSKPEDAAFSLLYNNSQERASTQFALLIQTADQLFRRIEVLSKIYQSIGKETESGLSGLDELYMGDEEEKVDTETLWGQVDLQNVALQTLLKQAIKRVSKATNKQSGPKSVRLLEDMDSDEVDSSSELDEEEPLQDDEEQTSEDEDNDEDEPKDDEARRMRERMERAMNDMDDDDDEEDEESIEGVNQREHPSNKSDADYDEPELVDPAAEELNNGFFDINEMEGFADDEEGYLPDSAYGEERPESTTEDIDKRTFHQKQRDGDFGEESKDNDSDEEDSEEDVDVGAGLFQKTTLQRRKNYREDDEVEALYGLYDDVVKDDDEDDDEYDDVINMTAADFFGKPDKKYFHKWKPHNDKNRRKNDDDDSWNEFEFGNSASEKGKVQWNEEDDEDIDDEDGEKESDGSDDEGGVMEDEAESIIPRKDKKSKIASKLEAQIQQLEKDMLAEKPWQMKGETTSSDRPVNSLLDSTPEFEIATKMAPIVTVEHTASIEEMIKKRILEEDWDDVVPRELPDVGWHKKRGELPEVSQEKSKLSLGELYEREYLKKATGYDVDAAEKETEEEKAINEMKALFANLCSKLDALSNYQFAPRPIEDEAEVRTITKPAIAMEEVLPLHVSDARGVAPEEVYGRKHGRDSVLRADSELEQQERKRLRSSKKAARRKIRKQKEADEKLISRLQPGLGLNNPYEKRKMREELQAARSRGTVTTGKQDSNEYSSSTTFFKRLQQEAHETVASGSKAAAKTSVTERVPRSSAKYKM